MLHSSKTTLTPSANAAPLLCLFSAAIIIEQQEQSNQTATSFTNAGRHPRSRPTAGQATFPGIFQWHACFSHKYLIREIAADICLRARGGNMQSNCEILINSQTNM